MKRKHFINFDIAGFTYWEGALVFNELNIGTVLQLKQEPDNKFDPYAVAIYYGEYKLGFVPRKENLQISKLLEMGYGSIFEILIQRINANEDPENQIGAIIYLKESK